MHNVRKHRVGSKQLQLQIVHLSDTHSRVDPHRRHIPNIGGQIHSSFAEVGGYQLIISAIREARENAQWNQRNFLIVHCGDSFQGSLYFQRYRGAVNVAMLNMLGLDAMAVGNHEFDLGVPSFVDFCEKANFPVVASNLKLEDCAHRELLRLEQSGQLMTSENRLPAVIKTMKDGTPVALLALTLETLPNLADTGPGVHVYPPVDHAKFAINSLRNRGIKHIIVLSHLGYEQDKYLARNTDGISAILGGHTHNLQGKKDSLNFGKTGECGEEISGVPIFHCGENAQHFGLYDLVLNEDGRVHKASGETIAPINKNSLPLEVRELLKHKSDICVTTPDLAAVRIIAQKFPLKNRKGSFPFVIKQQLPHVRVPDGNRKSILAPIVAEVVFDKVESAGFQPV